MRVLVNKLVLRKHFHEHRGLLMHEEQCMLPEELFRLSLINASCLLSWSLLIAARVSDSWETVTFQEVVTVQIDLVAVFEADCLWIPLQSCFLHEFEEVFFRTYLELVLLSHRQGLFITFKNLVCD